MSTQENGREKKRGRPVEKPMAEPIDDDPENVARALLFSKPKPSGEWKYLQKADSQSQEST